MRDGHIHRIAVGCILIIALVWAGCSDPQSDAFYERLWMPPSGIIETDADGRVINHPPGEMDWEVSPEYRGALFVEPAYPNPATFADQIQIPVIVRTANTIRGGLYVEYIVNDQIIRLGDHPEAIHPGAYVLRFPAALFGQTGLFRVYIVDGRGSIASYGDIRIQ
jgi:hypothetical protein